MTLPLMVVPGKYVPRFRLEKLVIYTYSLHGAVVVTYTYEFDPATANAELIEENSDGLVPEQSTKKTPCACAAAPRHKATTGRMSHIVVEGSLLFEVMTCIPLSL